MRVSKSLALVAAPLMLLACSPKEDGGSPAPAGPVKSEVAAPKTPLEFDQASPAAKVRLKLADEIARFPVLHSRLYDDETTGLKKFAEEAAKQNPPRPYESQSQWTLAATAAPLVSLRREFFEYTGGAHPNHGSGAWLWNTATDKEVQPAEVFKAGADMTPVQNAVCEAVKSAKTRREGSVPLSDMWKCPTWDEITWVLTPSKTPDKAAGLTVLIGPYVVGPYSEGDYEVVVPLSVFQPLLAPAYASAFAGEPARLGNADGTPTVRIQAEQ
ncbi:DUF4163 domain-containing protein [Caulobacter segnis]|uniref:DUF3298 and DUF4163 domain-containing protein n=1 Tax=Caulobacter segnis TaxID=88688 RepID=UPI00240FEA6F|nr:DUF3298 and DUF4163 domain-containing protein [Caulobacter segnis]MDG2521733.1 DUF4163 domain-containing protein [Caulobacter segnis]